MYERFNWRFMFISFRLAFPIIEINEHFYSAPDFNKPVCLKEFQLFTDINYGNGCDAEESDNLNI